MISIAIIDYGLGNVRSVANALQNQGGNPFLSRNFGEIMEADGVVLPGVGSFPQGISQLNKYGLIEAIRTYVNSGKPLLGICLGMQMLFSFGEEFEYTSGMNLIEGSVTTMASDILNGRLPHIGWNTLCCNSISGWDKTILHDIEDNKEMYFVHSYIASPSDEKHILATTIYKNIEFCSVVHNKNIYGCQFHPEKSGPIGLKVINNFIKISKGEI